MTQLAGIAIERRHAEAALRLSEARFRGLFEHVVEGVYQSGPDGRLREVNPALARMLGFTDVQDLMALESTRELYVDPAMHDFIQNTLLGQGELRNAEYELRRRDGEVLTVVENARLVRDADGTVLGFEGTLWNITERRRAELAVQAEKERAQVTLQSIGDAVITTDAGGLIDYLNRSPRP